MVLESLKFKSRLGHIQTLKSNPFNATDILQVEFRKN